MFSAAMKLTPDGGLIFRSECVDAAWSIPARSR